MSWLLARADLRNLLSDGATDKLRYRQKLVGRVDGVNVAFKSLEKRRLTNFATEADLTLGVFIDGTRLATPAGFASDNPGVGEVRLAVAPAPGVYVEGTFYLQWFLDSELDAFLTQAAIWLGQDIIANIVPGLRPAAIYYAAQEAYHKLALRWSETISSEFRLEDAPDKDTKTPMDMYRLLANDAKKKSVELRDQFYSGQGGEKKPNFASIVGRVSRVVPNR